MLNIDCHKTVLIGILREIYQDPMLRNLLGFKGGTAAMLFYELPRFSVDLDFDLLDEGKRGMVFKQLKEILTDFGKLTQAVEKQNTLFFLLNYQKGERNLKVEVSKRSIKAKFFIRNFLGMSMLVMKEDDMIAGKLAALLLRKKFAARDVFDLWFFLKSNWQINGELVETQTGLTVHHALMRAADKIKSLKKTELLSGLGDLLDNKQKDWVKEKLVEEAIFYLKLYLSK